MNSSNPSSQSATQLRVELRDRIKQKRQALTDASLQVADSGLSEQVQGFADLNTTFFSAGKRVAGYLSTGGEIPLDSSLRLLRATGASTWLPVIRNKTLLFAPLLEDTKLIKGKHDIPIPVFAEEELISPSGLDAILVPLVAFDLNGNRLGMGGGYYDRSFAHLHPQLQSETQRQDKESGQAQLFIGVAHAFQQVNAVPIESWDIPLDAVITEQAIHLVQNSPVAKC